jgi:hypothetical protein
MSSSPVSRFFERFPDPGVNVYPWLLAFLVLIIAECVGFMVSQIFMLVITYTAGKNSCFLREGQMLTTPKAKACSKTS